MTRTPGPSVSLQEIFVVKTQWSFFDVLFEVVGTPYLIFAKVLPGCRHYALNVKQFGIRTRYSCRSDSIGS